MTETAILKIDAIDPVPEPKPRRRSTALSDRNNGAARNLQRESEAARVLLAQYADIIGEDDKARFDLVEGETSLHELIAKVVEDVAADEANVAGIKAHIDTMQTRKKRIEARIDACRSAVLNAMSIGEIKKIELPIATVSRQTVAPKVQIIDETAIPSQFFKRAEPTLDKKAIGAALKDKQEVPGATLSNGGESLAIRYG